MIGRLWTRKNWVCCVSIDISPNRATFKSNCRITLISQICSDSNEETLLYPPITENDVLGRRSLLPVPNNMPTANPASGPSFPFPFPKASLIWKGLSRNATLKLPFLKYQFRLSISCQGRSSSLLVPPTSQLLPNQLTDIVLHWCFAPFFPTLLVPHDHIPNPT